jgi:hypothetical protein
MSLDMLLTDTAPTTDPDPRVLDAGRRLLDERVGSAQTVVLLHRRRARRRRVGLSLVGAAATVALAVTLVPWSGTPSAQAAEVVVDAGVAAGAQPDATTGTAPYWHSVSLYAQEGGGQDGTEHRRESWAARTAPGLLLDAGVSADPIGIGAALFSLGDSTVDWAGLDALPTDPAALRERLLATPSDTSRTEDDVLFDRVTDLLVESPASPALRQALWQVASQIDGVRLVGEVTDATGRAGTAIEQRITYPGGEVETRRLVVDTADGTLLEREIVTDTVTYRSTFLEQGPADVLPVQPQLLPGCTSWDRC